MRLIERRERLLKERLLFSAWCISLVSTAGSLFYSEIMKFYPCNLCWYQRILMYPLVIVIGISLLKKEFDRTSYMLALSIPGLVLSSYHYGIQKFGDIIGGGNFCGRDTCLTQYINWLGFITIPFLSLLSFLFITILAILIWKMNVMEERNGA